MGRLTDEEFSAFGDALINHGSLALIEMLNGRQAWSKVELSELLVGLAQLGGSGWVGRLCEIGADLNFMDEDGNTALSQCVHGAANGRDTFETAAELLALGASPNVTYMNSFSITYLAVLKGQKALALLFLAAGADLDKEEPDYFATDTLRQAMLRAVTFVPELAGTTWPASLIAIFERLGHNSRSVE